MIELLEASYSNFLGIRERQTLPLLHQGLTLIDGRNGSAKSTLPDGIAWCFFGRTIRNLSHADKVVNRFSKTDCSVSVSFNINDTPYVVTRYRKHSKWKNRVIIEANGSDITLKDDPNAQIEKLLGNVDFKTFVRTLVFTKRDTPSLASLKDEHQKQLFEKIVGVDQLYEAFKIAKENARQTRESIDVTNQSIASLTIELQLINERIKTLEQAQRDFEAQKKERIEELYEHVKELKVKTQSSVKAEIVVDDLEALSKSQEMRVKKLRQLIKRRKEAVTEADNIRSTHNTNKMLTERQVRDLEEEMTGLLGVTVCPQCKQTLDKEHQEKRKEHLATIRLRLEEETRSLSLVLKDFQAVQARASKTSRLLDRAMHALIATETKLESARDEIAKSKHAKKEVKDRLEAAEQKLEATQRISWPDANTLVRICNDNKHKTEELHELEATKRKHIKKLRYFDFWVQGFGRAGIPNDVINTVLPFLTQKTQHYLNRLADGKFKIDFSTKRQLANGEERDQFTTKVINKYGAGDYDGNSVGELGVVDLAITLAYQSLQEMRESTRINVSFWDEVFDGADLPASDAIVDLMNELSQKKDSLFVVSHNEGLKASFPHIITMSNVGTKGARIIL